MRTPACIRLTDRGVELRLRLTPKSSADRVEGLCETAEGPALAARVRAVPEDGKANDAAVRLIADWLGLAKSTITLTAGQKSRIKTVTIRGETGAISARLEQLLAQVQVRAKTTET